MDYQFVDVDYNGRNIKYKIYNGVYYNVSTPDEVVRILDYARTNNVRIRVFYCNDGGCDLMETYDTIGTVGSSCGKIKIPLIVKNRNSIGGMSILDACIGKITIDKRVVYQSENYHLPDMEIRTDDDYGCYELYVGGRGCIYAADTLEEINNEIAFYKGERNRRK